MFNVSYQLKNPPCIAEAIENDVVIIDLDNGTYYNATQDSGQVLNAILAGASIEELTRLIRSALSPENLKQALSEFIQTLLKHELIQSCELSSHTASPIDLVPETMSFQIQAYTDMQQLLSLDPIHDSDETLGWPMSKNPETV